MQKLLLTSAGFKNTKIAQSFLTILGKRPEEATIALVPTGARTVEERFYVEASSKELEELGFGGIVEIDAAEPMEPDALDEFDALYMCGGNTFYILKTIRETGFDRLIVDFVKRGGTYIGVSAGSILMGPDIEGASWGSRGDPNDVGLSNTKGLGLVPFAASPHFTPDQKADVDAFRASVPYPVLELTDEQAMLCLDENYVRIG